MAARPARLTTNRHGTYSLRWIVPVHCRGPEGRPREVRISLRTRDPVRARILALEFNLALERAAAMSQFFNRDMVSPWIITTPTLKVEVNGAEDQRLYLEMLEKLPDVRAAMMKAIQAGADPTRAMAAAVETLKQAKGAEHGVPRPIALRTAIESYVASRPALGDNSRSTAGEKERTLHLLLEHLASTGKDAARLAVHELARPEIIDFIQAYASRAGKAGAMQGLSPRTVLKAVGHLDDFFDHAIAQEWVLSNPIDNAFHKAIDGIRARATKSKVSQTYDLFDTHEIRLIFEPRRYLKNNNAADDFWAPLVGLFTGARLGEIVCLTPDTVVLDRDSGLFCLKVGTKNENSRRLVPVPEALIDLGFLAYVDHVRDLGATTLFPHRAANATRLNDPSKHLSRVFGQHLNDVGITDSKKVFHSFRHTVATRMHVNRVPIGDSEMIVGHAAQDLLQRLGAAGSRGTGPRDSTHLNTYVHAEAFEHDGMVLQARLKRHLDSALSYPLDMHRLRIAARIVLEHVVRAEQPGCEPVFTSGWHTNKRDYANRMVDRLQNESP